MLAQNIYFRFARLALAPMFASALFAASTVASAAPVRYTVQFTLGSSGTPTGSFDHDASQAINQQFSNFTVAFGSVLFDLTAAANNFSFRTDAGFFSTSCGTADNVNDAFQMLTRATCVDSVATLYQWQYVNLNPSTFFTFLANSGSGSNTASDSFNAAGSSTTTGGSSFGNGFIATADRDHRVPEPATWALIGLSLAGLGVTRRRRQQSNT